MRRLSKPAIRYRLLIIRYILHLVQDLRNPVNKDDEIIVPLPSAYNKELVDMISLTTCMFAGCVALEGELEAA